MSRNFTTELARRIGRDRKATETLIAALSQALRQHCSELDRVAIPAFGTFEPVKHDEKIVTDRSTGHRIMLPPEVELTFKPASKLRKLAENREEE